MKTKSFRVFLVVHLLLAAATLNLFAASAASPRERLLLDFGWKFHLGNDWGIGQNLAKAGSGSGPAGLWFSDASWRTVNLPHDWAVELPFDKTADSSHGFKALGHDFPSNSVAWYRRTFELPKADAGKRLWLEFDGAFRDCQIFVNGWFVSHHESGYGSFRCDITDVADCGGINVVAVKVDASEFEGWFYEGAGIYRHVWLVKTAPVAIAPDGIFVHTEFNDNMPEGPATVCIETRLLNLLTNSTDINITHELFDPSGKLLTKTFPMLKQPKSPFDQSASKLPVEFKSMIVLEPAYLPTVPVHTHPLPPKLDFAGRSATPPATASVRKVELWSPESPNLYKLVTTVENGGQVVDRQETEFGIRTVAFDKDKGFLLNGKPYLLKGTCNHQDHAGVGAALPDALQYFRIAKLKELGINAYRTSHNPPTPELLEACDHLGMLVMDENRLLGSDPLHLKWFEEFIRRDRNHPSVAIWSLANEEFSAGGTPAGKRVGETMQDLVRRLDPTRPVTYNAAVGNEFTGVNEIIEVRGWSYHIGTNNMDAYHAAHPNQPNVGSEQGSTVSTRGIYTNDAARGYVSAYDDNAQPWSNTAEQWWSFFDPRPWLSGGFIWTGFDYRGEPTPYRWPCINSHFGILDLCGFRKDNSWYYQAWWSDKPVLHLLPHWNWPGREGQEIDARALSNCEEVELFLNGRSLGRQTMKKDSELKWKVKYAPGALSAKGYKNGQLVAETKVETTGVPAAVQLTPDRPTLNADGEDVSVFTVAVTDAQGRVVPVAADLIHFELSGPGKILGVGNGDPSCHEPDVYLPVLSSHSVAMNDGWRWEKTTQPWNASLPEFAAAFNDSAWVPADVQSLTNQLGDNEHGVFRTHLKVTEKELAADAVELCFGTLNGTGKIYVNGQKSGETHDGGMASSVDVKHLLHPGDNPVAVLVENYSSSGGITKGVTLRMQDKPVLPEWRRSVFNGLAQIIVQSTQEPGAIKLTATAEGLSPATVSVPSQPCTPRPVVP
jgi:beta-galactosidase